MLEVKSHGKYNVTKKKEKTQSTYINSHAKAFRWVHVVSEQKYMRLCKQLNFCEKKNLT